MPGEDRQIQDQSQIQSGVTDNAFTTGQTQATNATQSGETGPWAQAQPALKALLQKYGMLGTDVTKGQADAATKLTEGAAAIPDFSGAGNVNRLFSTDTTPQVGMLTNALKTLEKNIGATASGAELDPYSTPGFKDALSTVQDDITNRVKSTYAASGRDPSGAGSFAGSLARGLAQGVAPIILNQANANKQAQMDAAKAVFGGEQGTAGQVTSQEQVPLANIIQGIGAVPGAAAAFTTPGTAALGAANVAQELPYGNLSKMLAPLLQIAGLGQSTSGATTGGTTTSGTGTSHGTSLNFGQGHGETTQPQSLMSNILGGITGAAGLASLFGGGAGSLSSMLPLLALSDERTKEDIEPIGKLDDGQDVVRFRYKGEPKMHVGLLAQQVEDFEPGAVHNFGSLKLVDYKRATDRAAEMRRAA